LNDLGWMWPKAALALLIGWITLASAVIAALGTHAAAALFALALGLVTVVCLRGRLRLSLMVSILLALAFAACQLITGTQPLAVDLAGGLEARDVLVGLSPEVWAPALLGSALILATVPLAGLPGNHL
jgi:hypothetical protein